MFDLTPRKTEMRTCEKFEECNELQSDFQSNSSFMSPDYLSPAVNGNVDVERDTDYINNTNQPHHVNNEVDVNNDTSTSTSAATASTLLSTYKKVAIPVQKQEQEHDDDDDDERRKYIHTPRPQDVVSGAGGNGKWSSSHPGNQFYRALIAERKEDYHRARKEQQNKSYIALEILRKIQQSGGRFLKKVVVRPLDGQQQQQQQQHYWWVELEKYEIISKTTYAFNKAVAIAQKKKKKKSPTIRTDKEKKNTLLHGDDTNEDEDDDVSSATKETTTAITTKLLPVLAVNIQEPHDHDVLSGRGHYCDYHEGNAFLRETVQQYKFDYLLAPKEKKGLYSQLVLNKIQEQKPPGRFLQQDKETKLWNELSDKKSLQKSRQVLRENAPELVLQEAQIKVTLLLRDYDKSRAVRDNNDTANTTNNWRIKYNELIQYILNNANDNDTAAAQCQVEKIIKHQQQQQQQHRVRAREREREREHDCERVLREQLNPQQQQQRTLQQQQQRAFQHYEYQRAVRQQLKLKKKQQQLQQQLLLQQQRQQQQQQTITSSHKKRKAGQQQQQLRNGKWTPEEEMYANQLIVYFTAGLLPDVKDGTTVLIFLSDRLNCAPTRIQGNKKILMGSKKSVFRRRLWTDTAHSNWYQEQMHKSCADLNALERRFVESMDRQQQQQQLLPFKQKRQRQQYQQQEHQPLHVHLTQKKQQQQQELVIREQQFFQTINNECRFLSEPPVVVVHTNRAQHAVTSRVMGNAATAGSDHNKNISSDGSEQHPHNTDDHNTGTDNAVVVSVTGDTIIETEALSSSSSEVILMAEEFLSQNPSSNSSSSSSSMHVQQNQQQVKKEEEKEKEEKGDGEKASEIPSSSMIKIKEDPDSTISMTNPSLTDKNTLLWGDGTRTRTRASGLVDVQQQQQQLDYVSCIPDVPTSRNIITKIRKTKKDDDDNDGEDEDDVGDDVGDDDNIESVSASTLEKKMQHNSCNGSNNETYEERQIRLKAEARAYALGYGSDNVTYEERQIRLKAEGRSYALSNNDGIILKKVLQQQLFAHSQHQNCEQLQRLRQKNQHQHQKLRYQQLQLQQHRQFMYHQQGQYPSHPYHQQHQYHTYQQAFAFASAAVAVVAVPAPGTRSPVLPGLSDLQQRLPKSLI